MSELIVLSIFLFGLAVALSLLQKYNKDLCLKDFNGYPVTIAFKDGEAVEGKFHVEKTGVEVFHHPSREAPPYSYILYKEEFPKVSAFVRFSDTLSENAIERRKKQIDKVYNPNFQMRLKRKTINLLKTTRDGMMDIIALFVGYAKKTSSPMGHVLGSKQATQISEQATQFIGAAFDPLLEFHIGRKVLVEVVDEKGQLKTLSGILKEYTAEFLELMDVDYPWTETSRKADIVIRRESGLVRHLGEPTNH